MSGSNIVSQITKDLEKRAVSFAGYDNFKYPDQPDSYDNADSDDSDSELE